MLQRCRESVRLAAVASTVRAESTKAVLAVIEASAQRSSAVKEKLLSGIAIVRRNGLLSLVDLIEQHTANMVAAAAHKADRARRDTEKASQRVIVAAHRIRKAATRKNNSCWACPSKARRTGARWAGCPCGGHWVRPDCPKETGAIASFIGHVSACGLKLVGVGDDSTVSGSPEEAEEYT